MRPFLPEREILEIFAALLEYPCGDETDAASRGAAALSADFPDAAALLEEVRLSFALSSRDRAEEIFTATFDLQATCAPYVGFHLFGEGYKRRVFLSGMSALYASRGFSPGGELPDHLAVVLRFLANSAPDEQTREIVEDGLIPALSKMIDKFGDAGNPYGNILRALRMVFPPGHQGNTAETPRDRWATEVGSP